MRKLEIIKLTIFTIAILGLGFFAFSAQAQAATTHYVSPSGSGPDCSNTAPCALSYGVNTKASPGDTVIAKAGTYHESLTITKAGITLQGELDGDNRLSIIDPYTDVSDGIIGNADDWTADGDGVYKKNFSYPVYAMNTEVNGTRYNIMRLCQGDDSWPISGGPAAASCSDWSKWLRLKDELHPWPRYGEEDYYVNIFDIFETYFTCLNEAPYTCRIRFRDQGTNINTKILYAAQNTYATITVSASNVTIKNLDIRAVAKGVSIGGIWAIEATADNVSVDNCKISLGKVKVWVTSAGTNAMVKDNILTDFDYAHEFVANPEYRRGAGDIDYGYNYKVKSQQYNFEKYKMSPDGDSYVNTGVYINGNNVTVDGNTIFNLHNAVDSSNPGTIIKNNHISYCSSVGVVFPRNSGTVTVNNNTIEDVNTAIRFMDWGGAEDAKNGGGINSTRVYIYSNKIWSPLMSPHGLGTHIRFHYWTEPSVNGPVCLPNCGVSSPGHAYIYHNSFSGGNNIIGAFNTAEYSPNGFSKIYVINNIISADYSIANAPSIPYCDKNWVAGKASNNTCTSGTNIFNGSTMMTGWTTVAPHEFDITGTTAVDNGVDISGGWQAYPALPGFTAGYGGTDGKPNMGAIQFTPADVNEDGRINIKDIQEVIRCIINSGTCNFPDRSDVNYDDSVNIKDIQEVIRKIINP